MEDPNHPGLPEIHNIDAGVFERINNGFMDLKRNFREEALIDQMIQMNKIMNSLFNQVSKTVDHDALDPSATLTAHGHHLRSHDQLLETHDRHLSTHDGHLQTHGEYLELLNNKLNSLSS